MVRPQQRKFHSPERWRTRDNDFCDQGRQRDGVRYRDTKAALKPEKVNTRLHSPRLLSSASSSMDKRPTAAGPISTWYCNLRTTASMSSTLNIHNMTSSFYLTTLAVTIDNERTCWMLRWCQAATEDKRSARCVRLKFNKVRGTLAQHTHLSFKSETRNRWSSIQSNLVHSGWQSTAGRSLSRSNSGWAYDTRVHEGRASSSTEGTRS